VPLVLKHDIKRIKNGFEARSPELRLAAHGHSADVARRNLERTALLLLSPFDRGGVLEEEVRRLGLRAEEDGSELVVMTCD
jgi:hypothetical protein